MMMPKLFSKSSNINHNVTKAAARAKNAKSVSECVTKSEELVNAAQKSEQLNATNGNAPPTLPTLLKDSDTVSLSNTTTSEFNEKTSESKPNNNNNKRLFNPRDFKAHEQDLSKYTDEEIVSIYKPFPLSAKEGSYPEIYSKWLADELRLEPNARFCYMWAGALPTMLLYSWYLYIVNPWDNLRYFLIAFFLEPFIFVVTHVNVHCNMLQGYQKNAIINPYAYFHHYTDSRLYGICPYRYFNVLYLKTLPLAAFLGLLIDLDPVFVLHLAVVGQIDFQVHQWVHTNFSKMNSKNPLDVAYFTGLKQIIMGFESIDLVSITAHKQDHHAESANGQHLTIDFCDLRVPFTFRIADWFANTLYQVWQKQVLVRIRGTRMPTWEGKDKTTSYFKDVMNFDKWFMLSWGIFVMLPVHGVIFWLVFWLELPRYQSDYLIIDSRILYILQSAVFLLNGSNKYWSRLDAVKSNKKELVGAFH